MKWKKWASMLLVGVMAIGLMSGCSSSSSSSSSSSDDSEESDSSSSSSSSSGSYDLYIFNTKGENADAMEAAVEAFEEESGYTVKVFSLGSGTDSEDLMRTELNSSTPPAIFCCSNAIDLIQWVEGGFAMDLSEATNEEFIALVEDIPDSFHLTDGNANYGIPFNVEGYGLIVDTEMLDAIFGEDNTDAFIEAFKTASYDEFADLVVKLQDWIRNDTVSTVTLSGVDFAIADEKTGKAESLNGVFSVAGSETWTYGDHLVNIAIDAFFSDSLAASNATAEEVEAGRGAFEAYAEFLDLKTSNATTDRGPELINSTTNGYDAQVVNFANSESIFVKQGNWTYTNIIAANEDIGETLTFLPIKLPFDDDDVVVEGLTADDINTSISVFVPNYYLINAKASDSEKEVAQEFLVWLNTSETGQKYVMEDMAFIPYNADPAEVDVGYSLGNSIVEYINEDKTITNAYAGTPSSWSGDTLGQYLMENYVNTAEWPDDAYEDIADYAISTWIEMAGL